MTRVESEIIIKRRAGVNDPAGMTIKSALNRLGFENVTSITTGKHFLIESNGQDLEQMNKDAVERAIEHPNVNQAIVRNRIIED